MAGGVADHLHGIAQVLAGRTTVTVRTTAGPNGVSWEHAYRLEKLDELPKRHLGDRPGDWFPPIRKLNTARYFRALRRHGEQTVAGMLEEFGGDMAVMIGIWDTASHFWCEACRRAGVPYYLVAYGAELVHPLYGSLPHWREVDFAGARRVFAVSRATADLAASRFHLASAPAVVHPTAGPRPSSGEISARAAKLRQALGFAERASPILLSVGRLVPRKGFDLVLHSVARLRRQRPDLRYIILGTGPERMRLEQLAGELGIASSVRMLGHADEITKWAAYELCDLFVMPNRSLGGTDWEGFGIVFLEAALASRAAIGGVSGGTADAIVDDATGLLVDPERPGELTETIRRLLDDAELRVRFGQAAADRAQTRFSSAALAESLNTGFAWGDA
jgi:phosphatidyl-myo-inositol dimannoside synthase